VLCNEKVSDGDAAPMPHSPVSLSKRHITSPFPRFILMLPLERDVSQIPVISVPFSR
jgi:hypothetical protein